VTKLYYLLAAAAVLAPVAFASFAQAAHIVA